MKTKRDIVTWSKMQKVLKTYMSDEEIASLKYIKGSQWMCDDGYAYARFIDIEGFEHMLCISDYIKSDNFYCANGKQLNK